MKDGKMTLLEHPKERDTYRHTLMREQGAEFKKRGVVYQPLQRVPAYTLPQILEAYPEVEGVKIDIEGMEMEVLEEMEAKDWGNVKRLTFEYSHEYDDTGPRFRGILEKLKRHFTFTRPCRNNGWKEGKKIT